MISGGAIIECDFVSDSSRGPRARTTRYADRKSKRATRSYYITPSANREEEVFNEPFRFVINVIRILIFRFGVGEHFCLGANLARFELEVIFRALIKHVEYVEYTGSFERLRSNFVGGIKRMRVRIKLRPHPM